MRKNGKILIFIVAFNAERHIEKVLARIPPSIYESYDYEILIIDDASSDETFKIASLYRALHRELNLKVLFNPDNLGYGGNQKLGYRYAIANGFDAVVLLHGDGQYAPELLEEMLSPILDGKAEMVMGSRMIQAGKALKGGMPAYKFLGNKILTFIQNKLLGVNLSEFHSGYRAFSTKALSGIPFERNSHDFHFDTQIIIQMLRSKSRVAEIPIPTYYGTEICHVNGMKYAWDVVKTTFLSKVHDCSILYQREYDIKSDDCEARRHALKLGYASSHSFALDAVPAGARVLELGCKQGQLSAELLKKGCYVLGIDSSPLNSPESMSEFLQLDLNKPELLPQLDSFDCVLMLDVLAHLDDPERFLDILREKSGRKCPKLIATVPNVAFFIVRLQLLLGNFNYNKQGILDFSHRRLLTFKSLKIMLLSCGYRTLKIRGVPAPFPKAFGKKWIGMGLLRLNSLLISFCKSLFSYQIYIEAKPTPVVSELLAYAVSESEKRRESYSQEPDGTEPPAS